jgi:SEC-C motif domain protein
METLPLTLETSSQHRLNGPACPCCSGLPYEICCEPVITGAPAATAEALVRSRYTAFAKRCLDHVEHTHAAEIKADFNRAEAETLAEECEWLELRIHKAVEEGDAAEIEYAVRVRRENRTLIKGVQSRFRRDDGKWFFLSSKPAPHLEQARSHKIGRNDPCLCGSGKKYKKCCGIAAENG